MGRRVTRTLQIDVPRAATPAVRTQAFTLVEMMITIGIIALLLSILLPALGATMASARGFKCQMSLRSVALDFGLYADDELHGDRGRDEALGGRRFTLSAFVDSQYGAAEFWRYGGVEEVSLPDDHGNDPLRCPDVQGDLKLSRGGSVFERAVKTPESVSYSFNMRLHRAEVVNSRGFVSFELVTLSSDVMQHGRTPLVWDTDAIQAHVGYRNPSISAPSLDSQGPYKNDRYWYPAMRHNGRMNAAFIDGHVDLTHAPLEESNWDWAYQGGK